MRSPRNPVRFSALVAQRVRATEDGTLRVLGSEWVEVAPLRFQERFGDQAIVFREDADGSVSHFLLEGLPVFAFERVPTWERPIPQAVTSVLALISVGVTLLLPVAGWFTRRWYGVAAADLLRIPRRARLTLWSAAALLGVGLVWLAVLLSDPMAIAFEVPSGLSVALLLPVLATALTLASVVFAIQMWRRNEGRTMARVFYSLGVISFCVLLWQLHTWNVLGWRY